MGGFVSRSLTPWKQSGGLVPPVPPEITAQHEIDQQLAKRGLMPKQVVNAHESLLEANNEAAQEVGEKKKQLLGD